MKKKKLTLNRETVRALSPNDLTHAAGAMRDLPTRTCYCTYTCLSACGSCFDTDCCLYSVRVCDAV